MQDRIPRSWENIPDQFSNAALGEEKKCRWLKAATVCANLLALAELPRATRADAQERMGRAFFRGAFQAGDSREFRKNLHKAIAAYKNSRRLIDAFGDLEGRHFHCLSMEAYIRFWLASSSSSKKRHLSESWNLAKKAMKSFDNLNDPFRFGETFDLLSPITSVLLNLEWAPSKRVALHNQAIEYGRRAIEILSNDHQYKDTLTKVCVRMALLIDSSREELGEVTDQKKLDKEAKHYWETATAIDEEQALLGLPRPPDGFFHIFDTRQRFRIWEKALKIATRRRERFAIGWVCDQLAGHFFWEAVRTDDTKLCISLSRKSLEFAERALEIYTCFNFVSQGASVMWPNSPYAEHFQQLSWFHFDREKRQLLLTKSLHEASELLEVAERSLYPKALAYAHHISSRIQLDLAQLESNPLKKGRLITEASKNRALACSIVERTQPRSLWKRGVYFTYLAETKRNLSELEKNPRIRKHFLMEAIQTKATALKLSTQYVESIRWGKERPLHGAVGRQYSDYGQMLMLAFETLGEEEHLAAAANAFTEAVIWCRKAGTKNRGIAAYSWMAGRAHDRLQQYSTAAHEFTEAAKVYQSLAGKVALGPLFEERAKYLRASATVELARDYHARMEYKKAWKSYLKAARIYNSTQRWDFLAPYYKSIAQLEHGEDLSKVGENEESVQAFEDAAILFQKAVQSFEANRVEQERPEENTLVERLAGEPVVEYCRARILIEEGKAAHNNGDHLTGSLKFGEASKEMDEIAKNLPTSEGKREILFVASLAEGWGLMTQGLADNSVQLIQQARDKFENTAAIGYNQNSRLLSSAYGFFCAGLIASIEFTRKSEPHDYEDAIKCLTTALDRFSEAGFTIAYREANATRRFLDAQLQIFEAGKEKDPTKKTGLLEMGITLLRNAADLFDKAHQPSASQAANKLIQRLHEDRMLSADLAEISKSVSSLRAFEFPVPMRWGGPPAGFVGAHGIDVEANLKTDRVGYSPGEDLKVVVEISNVGTKSVRLVRVDDILEDDTQLVDAPSSSKIQGRSLIMDGKRIAPSNREEIILTMRIGSHGLVSLRPRLVLLDDSGKELWLDLPPKILSGSRILDYLSHEFHQDYSVKELTLEHAGWRTLMDVAGALKIPRSSLYGDSRYRRKYGRQIEPLIRLGLAEIRIFPKERGRGGQIAKIRLAYNRYVARQYAEVLKAETKA